jgi:hypothetical protein
VSFPKSLRNHDIVQFNPTGSDLDFQVGLVTTICSDGTVGVNLCNRPPDARPILSVREENVTKIGRLKWSEQDVFDPEGAPYDGEWTEVDA